MGLFSRKEKAPKSGAGPNGNLKPALNIKGRSASSLTPVNSAINSPKGSLPLASPGRGGIPNLHTPLTPFSPFLLPAPSPVHLPKMDLPKPPDARLDPAGYLRSLPAVRERCRIVTDRALKNDLKHFDVDMRKFPDVVTFVAGIIKVRSQSYLHPLIWAVTCASCAEGGAKWLTPGDPARL